MKPAVLALTFASMYWGECWAQLKDETLVATIPTGFKIGSQTNHDRVTTLEWIKESESLQNWTEMVTVQVDRGSNKTTAPQFLQGIGTKWLHACKDSVANQKPDAEANGYPISMLLVHCPLNASTRHLLAARELSLPISSSVVHRKTIRFSGMRPTAARASIA